MLFLYIVMGSIFLSILSGGLSLVFLRRSHRLMLWVHSVLLTCSGVGVFASGLLTLLYHSVATVAIPLAMPFMQGSLHLDALSGFFLCLIGIVVIPISFYIPSYLKPIENVHQPIGSVVFFTGLFVASLCLLVLAFDVFSFLFAWEMMAISSYFLVIHEHQHAENRQAGFIYLLMAHLSGLLILVAFVILGNASGGFDFQTLSAAPLTPIMATIAFLLALFGFGMKSGLAPLHVWLPRAHPVAPSHISALMSGVMLKIAIYGFIRFIFLLKGSWHWQWGVFVLLMGCFSALLGILYALVESDLKRLLAYSSIENVGIIFIGLGLLIIFVSTQHEVLGVLSLLAALYHCINHALFKSLLFLGSGAVLQQTHEHSLERLGGLIHRMPQTAFFFLIGCLSISALPPFNGFVSEWLLFQSTLQTAAMSSSVLRITILTAAAALALTAALAATCFVKLYGIAFLGKPRTREARHAKRVGFGMRAAMGFLAVFCLIFGIFPSFVLRIMSAVPTLLMQVDLSNYFSQHGLWIVPLPDMTFTYNAVYILIGLLLLGGVSYFFLKNKSHSFSFKQVPAWDCGFGGLNARMQYSATAFSMPFRRVFKGVWKCDENFVFRQLQYDLKITEWIWHYLYQPFDRWMQKIAKYCAQLQGGSLRVYLAYSFFTVLILLWIVS
jgi:formate hydrogenlyase subunit 3/multisubunit Na+/H+ antiporter MnhD subunit